MTSGSASPVIAPRLYTRDDSRQQRRLADRRSFDRVRVSARARDVLTVGAMSYWCPALAIGPDEEITVLRDEDILDVDDEAPLSRLDHEALTDDAC